MKMGFLSIPNTTRMCIMVVNMISSVFVHGQNTETELRLREDIFSNHSNVVRPVVNISMPVEIDATLELFKIANFDTVNGVLVSQCSLELSWYDEFLSWDPDKYGNISMMYVPAKEIWRPNIVICNSATEQFIDIGTDNVVLHSDGRLVSRYQEILRTFCKIDALNYPFDKQHCRILFGIAVEEIQHIVFKPLHYHKSSFFRNFEWDIKMKGIGKPLNNAGRSMTKATIYFSRKIRITTIASMVPSAIFTVVSLFVFLLPTESGEKVSLSTTLLLSKIVYLVQMDKVTPRNSQSMPLLTVYILILTVMSGVNTIGAIMESRIYFTKDMKAYLKNHSFTTSSDERRVKAAFKRKKVNQVSELYQNHNLYVENGIHDSFRKTDANSNSVTENQKNNDVSYNEQNARQQKLSNMFLGIGVIYITISIIAICLKAFVSED